MPGAMVEWMKTGIAPRPETPRVPVPGAIENTLWRAGFLLCYDSALPNQWVGLAQCATSGLTGAEAGGDSGNAGRFESEELIEDAGTRIEGPARVALH